MKARWTGAIARILELTYVALNTKYDSMPSNKVRLAENSVLF